MKRYQCIACDRSGNPIVTNGAEWSEKITAESAGKARYRFLLQLRDFYPHFSFRDIRVLSLGRVKEKA